MKSSEFNPGILPVVSNQGRSGILLIPRRIYYEWSKFMIDEEVQRRENGTEFFLLPPFASIEKAAEFCSLFFDLFFQHELRKCSPDPSFWPVNRTYEMFLEWFEVKITNQVSALK